MKGLDNLIRLYDPDVIGVSTTCLAETIGEDIPGMIQSYRENRPGLRAKIVTVSSAGYAGTQYEGFFRALRALVEQVEPETEKHGGINVVAAPISPADARWLRECLAGIGLNCVLLPDPSSNLDGGATAKYERLPRGGIALGDIARMAGAVHTVELAEFVPEDASPALYLNRCHGVPFTRLPLPVGLKDMDRLADLLISLGGRRSSRLEDARSRRLDAMVDSHKYSAKVKAAVFGEPDFVYAVSRLLCENGALPVLAATGSRLPGFADHIRPDIEKAAAYRMAEECTLLDDCDFETIESEAVRLGVNVLIGSSDARRIEERRGIPLVRAAFPVHDHVGCQRIRIMGYEGGLDLLDRIVNAVLGNIESTFRENLKKKYYLEKEFRPAAELPGSGEAVRAVNRLRSGRHPCFNGCGGLYARIHLPVAPDCNIQCNYCVRKFACPNESRPGVAARVITPGEAVARFVEFRSTMESLSVAGVAGPGDALADWDRTRETIRLIRAVDPDVIFCLSTNGLMLPRHVREMANLGVSHLTVTVNAVDPVVGAAICRHVDYLGTRYQGVAGAAILMANQFAGIAMAVASGIVCKMNTVMLKGINDAHIPLVAAKARELGCDLGNVMQMVPVKGSVFADSPLVSNREIKAMRERCGVHLRQMAHCRQCRADAAGRLDEDRSILFDGGNAAPAGERQPGFFRFAVSSKGGILVDQHFGQATDFYIFEYRDGVVRFRERRGVPGNGPGGCDCRNNNRSKGEAGKLDRILSAISDCDCVLTMRMGESPRRRLRSLGIAFHETYNRIEDAVREAAQIAAAVKASEA